MHYARAFESMTRGALRFRKFRGSWLFDRGKPQSLRKVKPDMAPSPFQFHLIFMSLS